MSSRKVRYIKKASALFAFTFLVVTFQNCGVPVKKTANEPATVDTRLSSKIDLNKISRLNFASKAQSGDLDLDMDLNTGVISAQDGKTYCLSNSEMGELRSLFSSAEVCDENAALAKDTVCTMVYVQSPYAKIYSDIGDIHLGEIANGCNAKVDLCGSHSSMLQGILAHLSSDLQSRACEFQDL